MPSPPTAVIHVDKGSLGFAAAHFNVLPGGRELLHGHNYTVGLFVGGSVKDDGTVVDFYVLKEALRAECDALDHRMIVPTESPHVHVHETDDGHVGLRCGEHRFLFPVGDCRLLPIPNATCEALAGWLVTRLRERLGDVDVTLEVVVEESPGQGARVAEPARR